MGWPSIVFDGQPLQDPLHNRIELGLVTLGLAAGKGAWSAEAQLPMGVVSWLADGAAPSGSGGLGDLELRGRFGHVFGTRVRLAAGLGVALPTGASAERAAVLASSANYLTLGRGASWALADLDLRLRLLEWACLTLGTSGRVALGPARSGFEWGPEVRGAVGASVGPFFDRLTVSASVEAQVRGQSKELDPFTHSLIASTNTGGTWWTAVAVAQVRVLQWLSLFVSGRVPLGQQVSGAQFIPGPGAFAGVAGAWEFAPPRARPTVEPGRITVVDYWASWCEPCLRLTPILEALERQHPWLTVQRVDVTRWSPEELEQVLPGVPGLPVIEIFNADGSLRERLVGTQVEHLAARLREVRP